MMTIITALISQSDEISKTDPSGLFIALVSIAVVFGALVILYCAYSLISIIVKRTEKADIGSSTEHDEEVAAAIGMALSQYLNEEVHDAESYKITIRRKKQ